MVKQPSGFNRTLGQAEGIDSSLVGLWTFTRPTHSLRLFHHCQDVDVIAVLQFHAFLVTDLLDMLGLQALGNKYLQGKILIFIPSHGLYPQTWKLPVESVNELSHRDGYGTLFFQRYPHSLFVRSSITRNISSTICKAARAVPSSRSIPS